MAEQQPKNESTPSPMKLKLNEDMKQAMRAGDKEKLGTLRMLLSAIKYAEIAKMQQQFSDADIFGVIAKEIKQRKESIEAFKTGNRPDLQAIEETELAILQSYMPAQASREELVAAAKQAIAETGASNARDKGKVMPKMMAQFKGKADGKLISDIVTALLGG
jgi:uncharacterized protein